MTSCAFILGVVPVIVSTGAGAEMRRVLGTAVFSGMLGVTLFGIFLTPVFFYVIEGFVETPFFSSQRVRTAGKVLLFTVGILTLGLVWILIWLLGLLLKPRGGMFGPPKKRPVTVNGSAPGKKGSGPFSHQATPSVLTSQRVS